MDRSTRDMIWRRAGDACEYCRMPQSATPLIPFHVEHIIARQHGGGGEIIGLTPTGRATVRLLRMNAQRRVELREEWLRENGSF